MNKNFPWNDTKRGKPKNSELNLSQCRFFLCKSDVGSSPSLHGERPMVNRVMDGSEFRKTQSFKEQVRAAATPGGVPRSRQP